MKLVVYSNVMGQPISCEILEQNEKTTKIRTKNQEQTLINEDIISIIPDVVDPSFCTVTMKKVSGIRGVYDIHEEKTIPSSQDDLRDFFITDDNRQIEVSKGYYELISEEDWKFKSAGIHQMMLGGSGI